MSAPPPLDDNLGNWTIIGLAAGGAWVVVRSIIAIGEWLYGERKYPWSSG